MKKYIPPLSTTMLEELSACLKSGGTVLFPTETVYGIAAHPEKLDGIRRIIELKSRDPNKPMQLLLSDAAQLEKLSGLIVPEQAKAIARRFWPGALTMVLHYENGGTEGLRVPASEIARQLCAIAGGSLRTTSANVSGEAPALSSEEAEAAIPEADAIVVGEVAAIGMASTVCEITPTGELRILRAGPILDEELRNSI
jgi:L-threonylcarbamoyladenylate synthase